jgi:hypothetical protein
MLLQAIPIPKGEAARATRLLFKAEACRYGMTFSEVANDADLRVALKTGEYFYAEVPGDAPDSVMRLVYFTPSRYALTLQIRVACADTSS